MNELVVMHDHQAVTTSLKVAEVFEKNHRDVMRRIEGLRKNAQAQHMFAKSISNLVAEN